MNSPRILLHLTWLLAVLSACSQVQDVGQSYDVSPAVSSVVQPAEARLTYAPRQDERAARGDTLSLHYKELEKFLPAEVAGFVPDGQPMGESVNIGGVSYSTCEQHYRKGDQRLKVQLVDYNGASALYAGATAMMASGFSQENDEQLMQGCEMGVAGVLGFETLQKKEQRAAVALGVADRFFVSVESTRQQNTRLVKDVARALDLKQLAAL